jgi:hypothetical protein
VPDAGGQVRVRAVAGAGALPAPRAAWNRTRDGYAVHLTADIPNARSRDSIPVQLDLIVNETTAGRERRRGQLVLSGAAGEFAYLAGDRHDPERLLEFILEP